MIRFDNVSKIYSTDVVLKNINWEIRKGEKIGLVGSNGAGKSTQFKILIGEEDQTSGLVLKEGSPKISHLKQELDCNLNRTVREELESSFKDIQVVSNKLLEIENEMKFLETSKDAEKLDHLVNQLAKFQEKFEVLGGYQMQAEVEKILPKLGFSQDDADKLVGNFSGGWQMKVALGKIILQKPDLLLLDEPTNHLDLETIFWLEEYLISLKISIILISHDRHFLEHTMDRFWLVGDQKVVNYDDTLAAYTKQILSPSKNSGLSRSEEIKMKKAAKKKKKESADSKKKGKKSKHANRGQGFVMDE